MLNLGKGAVPIGAIVFLLVLLPAAAAAAQTLDREESEIDPARRPAGLAAWTRHLEGRQYRIGVPLDCAGGRCAGSAESPGTPSAPDRDRPNGKDGSR